MIAFSDTRPDTNVRPAEFLRLLGYPRDFELADRALELCEWARAWYAEHGRPWAFARQSVSLVVGDDSVVIDGAHFTSRRLAGALRAAGATSVVLVAVGAGPEAEREAQRLWRAEKPDEYFFLEIYGSAVVEHLVTMTGARICAFADAEGLAALPHYSPGYPEWDITEQSRLLELIGDGRPGIVEVLESGMLRPKKTLLAVFGVTPLTDDVRKLTDLVPCENCTLPACQFRRAPYVRSRRRSEVEGMRHADKVLHATAAVELQHNATYTLSARALSRWAGHRLSLQQEADGTINAQFRYDGTTCANSGREFQFFYSIRLASRGDGYTILDLHCAPAPGDEGHKDMCRYRAAGPEWMASIADEKPLLGHPLNDVLAWRRTTLGASCYCENDSSTQRWVMVLETVHYALVQQEKRVLAERTPVGVETT